jgi:membrane protein YqaA with SNARE-associated domain
MSSWRSRRILARVVGWAERNANAAWFPWVLATIAFVDYFTLGMIGFVLTPLLTLALVATQDVRRAAALCLIADGGCWAGAFVFSRVLGRLNIATRLAGSPQLDVARRLLQRHGVLAGLMNTLLPLPTIPLIVAAQAVDANVEGILLTQAIGRAVRYVSIAVAIFSGRSVYKTVGSRIREMRECEEGPTVAKARA